MEQCSQRPSKKQKVYKLCKNTVALIITLVALVPIVYLLGSDDAIYPSRPLFAAYAEDVYFQTKVTEIQTALNSSLIVNLYWQGDKKQNSVREWQHLQEFVRFLGHRLNNQQVTTVNRLIVPPEVKPQKKGKSGPSAESLRLVEQAYSLANSGEMNTLRNKLNKVALNTINRLKIKQKEAKNAGFAEVFKGRIIEEVLAPKVWIITIHPDNWQYHNSEQLKKQLSALGKEREKDRFVVVSTAPADTEWKRMKAIPINIDDSIFSNLKGKLKQAIKAAFPFEVNTTRVIESVLCHYESSLYHLNNFIQNCNTIHSCINSIKFISKKNKKGEDAQAMQLLNELCNIGHIDQENAEFQAVLDSLGFFDDYQRAEENMKLYFGVATGKKCKGSKQCNFEWLNTKPSPPPSTPKAPKSQKVSPQRPQKQTTSKKEASKQKLITKQKSQAKPKSQKQIKEQEAKQTIKVDKVKQVKTGKRKQKEKKVKQQKSQMQDKKAVPEEAIKYSLKQPNISTIQQEATLQTTQTQIVQQINEDNDNQKTSNISVEAEALAGQASETEQIVTLPTETDSSTAIVASEAESQCEKDENCEVSESSESQKQAASSEVMQNPQTDQTEPVQTQSGQTQIVATDEARGQVSDDTTADQAQVAQTEVQEEGQHSNQAHQLETPQTEQSNPDSANEGQQPVQQTIQTEEEPAELPQPPTESVPTESETIPLSSEEAAPKQA